VDGEPEYEISEILDSKLDNRRRLCKLLYLVKWSGYEGTDDETSWLLATELGNAPELINHFHQYFTLPHTFQADPTIPIKFRPFQPNSNQILSRKSPI